MSTTPLGTPFVRGLEYASRSFDYAQVDVFAEHALEGNALGVFTDARGLTDEEMQSLARETNLSETTFILPRPPEIERERGVHVRIFLTNEEVPFAGHPTLGTASWLYWNHSALRGAEEIALELGVGRIPVRFTAPQEDERGVVGTMQQKDPSFGDLLENNEDRAEIASVLGIAVGDLDEELPVQVVSTGMSFCVVPVRSLEVAARLRLNNGARLLLDRIGAKYFYCVTRAKSADWHARMLMDGGGEDPATGSAAGCTIAWLVRHGAVASGERTVIEQGIEMLRPSLIQTSASLEQNRVTKVFVGGRTIPVAMGRFFLP